MWNINQLYIDVSGVQIPSRLCREDCTAISIGGGRFLTGKERQVQPPLNSQSTARVSSGADVLYFPTAKRENRVSSVFSPNFCTAPFTKSPIVTSGFFTNGCLTSTSSAK